MADLARTRWCPLDRLGDHGTVVFRSFKADVCRAFSSGGTHPYGRMTSERMSNVRMFECLLCSFQVRTKKKKRNGKAWLFQRNMFVG